MNRARAAHMTAMSDNISAEAKAAREAARDKTTMQFGEQVHTGPAVGLLNIPTPPEETVYGVYRDGELVSAGEKGAGMDDAIHRAEVAMNFYRYDREGDKPVWTIRSEGSSVEVPVPYGDQGRIVGWRNGDAIAAEEMDERGVSLTQFEQVKVEPYIDLGPDNEGDLLFLERWCNEGDYHVSNVYATRDDETGGRRIDVATYENFLWNADTQFPDDEHDGDGDLDPDDDRPASVQRYEKWLDANEDIVRAVYAEWFNAELDVSNTWEYANVTLRTTVPYERFTESLVIEDVYPLLAKHRNETDPGTFGAPYVMAEVRRRAEKRDTLRGLIADRAGVAADTTLPVPTQNATLRSLDNEIARLQREGVTA